MIKQQRPNKVHHQVYPIQSWGIILFCNVQEKNVTSICNKPKFLIYQRRDSFEYVEVLRGAWASDGSLPLLFSLMTIEEKNRLLNHNFDDLWDDLWMYKDEDIPRGGGIDRQSRLHAYIGGYEKAKKRFESTVRHKLEELIQTPVPYKITEPPWGFPKGKKNTINETETMCALREFEEETHIPKEHINLWNVKPFFEVHKGSNNKLYSTTYFLGECKNIITPLKVSTPQYIRKYAISEEASEVQWGTLEELSPKINCKKQNILRKVVNILNNYYESLSPIANELKVVVSTEGKVNKKRIVDEKEVAEGLKKLELLNSNL